MVADIFCDNRQKRTSLLFTNTSVTERNSSTDTIQGLRQRNIQLRQSAPLNTSQSVQLLPDLNSINVTSTPEERPDSLTEFLAQHPAYFTRIPVESADQLSQLQPNLEAPRDQRVEVGTIKICCILNQASHPGLFGIDSDSEDVKEGQEPQSDAELVLDANEGDYFKAVKVGSTGQSVSLQPDCRYLLISSYVSPSVGYYRKQNVAPSHNLSSNNRRASRNNSTSSEERFRSLLTCYPHENYERELVKEDDQPNGKCGLYKMIKVLNPCRERLRLLKRRHDIFLVFIPKNAHDFESRGTKKKRIPCRCEIAKMKTIMLRELVATVMFKRTKELEKILLGTREASRDSESDENELPLNRLPVGWNFMDLLGMTKKSPPKAIPNLPLNNEIDSCHVSQFNRRQYLSESILNIRLQLIAMWNLACVNPRPYQYVPEPYDNIVFSKLSVTEMLLQLQLPSPSMSKYLESTLDPYLIARAPDRKIIDEIELRESSIQSELSKALSKIRLLTAVQELMHTFDMARTNRPETRDENTEGDIIRQQVPMQQLALVQNELIVEKMTVKLLEPLLQSIRTTKQALQATSPIMDSWSLDECEPLVWKELINKAYAYTVI